MTTVTPPAPLPSPSAARRNGLARYVAVWESLADAPDDTALARLVAGATTEDVHFRDPFNDVQGRDGLLTVLRHSVRQAADVRFTLHGTGWASDDTAYLHWTFAARLPVLGTWSAPGMSVICLDEAGLVHEHVDHWDAATHFLARIPGVGPLVRVIQRRAAAR